MKIEFDPSETGFWEAKDLLVMARRLLLDEARYEHNVTLLSYMEQIAGAHMNRPEFEELRTYDESLDEDNEIPFWEDDEVTSDSVQRQCAEAIGRAREVEQASLEVLAETQKPSVEGGDDTEIGEDPGEIFEEMEQKLDEIKSLLRKI